MLDWLEGELRQIKTQVVEQTDLTQRNQTQIWELTDQLQRSEGGAGNLLAQINLLTALPEDVRALRERIERMQATTGTDQDHTELIARQLRLEMQAERDDRNELRHRTEFAEQTAASLSEKFDTLEDLVRRIQDDTSIQQQRMEQTDINIAGTDARVGANAEAIRRTQSEGRTIIADLESHDRALEDLGQRLERLQENWRRIQEDATRFREFVEEDENRKQTQDAMRQANEETTERAAAVARDTEILRGNVGEVERAIERGRVRADQQDRVLLDLRAAVDEAQDAISRENERFLTFQEKVRRRQIADLEQEVRELKGQARPQPHG
jgi:chromosome segregation ATPase